jgi:hypothetical protein
MNISARLDRENKENPTRRPSMTTAKKPESVVIEFVKEKDTPNTVRYAEVVPDDDAAKIRTLYLQKHFTKALGNPERILVTIAAGV